MTSVKNAFNDLYSKIGRLKTETKQRSLMKRLADLAVDLIYKRVKKGYGVTSDKTKKEALPKFKNKSYIEFRKKVQLGEGTTPSKSNLTLSGQLLNAIYVASITANGFILKIKDNVRKAIKMKAEKGRKTFKRIKNTAELTNKELQEHVEKTRPFFALTQEEQKNLLQEFEKQVKLIVKDNFK